METGDTQEFTAYYQETAGTSGSNWWKSPETVLQYYVGAKKDETLPFGSILPINIE